MDRSNTSTSIQGGDVAPLPVAVIVGASSKYDKDGKVKDFPATSRWYVLFTLLKILPVIIESVTRQGTRRCSSSEIWK